MRKREETYLSGNLTAMIDVVFQLIIFFVCTVSMQDAGYDETINLAMAPHGAAVKQKNPLEITIDVDSQGHVRIARFQQSLGMLTAILKKVVNEYGAANVPVIIRGDGKTKHEQMRNVMDACGRAGVWKIKLAAYKEHP